MIRRLSQKQVLALKAAGTYLYVTYSQVMRLGIEKHRSNISGIFSGMRDCKRPLVRKIPHRNGTEAKHYLTEIGKEALLELFEDLREENIRYPKGIITSTTQDDTHRTNIIDIEIELDLACIHAQNVEITLKERYFDTVGNNRISKNLKSQTAIPYDSKNCLKADLVFKLKTPVQEELYLLELERGKDTKKAFQKCVNHGKAILLKSANQKYNFQSAYRTLWVFEFESIMYKTMERLREHIFFGNMTEFFLFKSLDRLQGDCFGGWKNVLGQDRSLYYLGS